MTIPDAATHSFGPPPHCRTCGEHGHLEDEHPRSTAPLDVDWDAMTDRDILNAYPGYSERDR